MTPSEVMKGPSRWLVIEINRKKILLKKRTTTTCECITIIHSKSNIIFKTLNSSGLKKGRTYGEGGIQFAMKNIHCNTDDLN